MKKYLLSSFLFVLTSLVLVLNTGLLNAGATSVYRPVMDSDYAMLFVGFITNDGTLTEDEIKNSIAYKLLTNTYEGEDEEARLFALNYFINTNTAQMAGTAEAKKQQYCNEIIYYLEKHLPSGNLSEDIINEAKNNCLDVLVEGMDDVLSGLFKNHRNYFSVEVLCNTYKLTTDTIGKAQAMVDYTMAAINGFGLVFESEMAGRYGYFQSYLSNRPTWDSPDDEIFRFIMEWNQSAYTVNNWAAKFLDCFTFITNKNSFLNHFDVLDYWAEYTYLLGEYVSDGASVVDDSMYEWPYKDEYITIDENLEVDSVRFIVEQYDVMFNYDVDIPAQWFPKNAGIGAELIYYSSDTNIINVDQSTGMITPVSPGEAYIYAESSNGCIGKCLIRVLPFTVNEINDGYEISSYYPMDTEVNIPDNWCGKRITGIGDGAFKNCTNITSVIIPDSVTDIGNIAFCNCRNLNAVYITDLASWCDIDFGSIDANPLYYAGNLYLNGKQLDNLAIPEGVTEIKDFAFIGCTTLTSATIPEGVVSVGEWAFEGCTSLKSIKISDSVTSLGDNAFDSCTSLVDITIPDRVMSIGEYAFENCSSLTSITIPDSVTSIGNFAFNDCSNLDSVYINDLASWCNIEFGDYDANPLCCAEQLYLNGQLVTELVIPKGVTTIKSQAFYKSTSLTSVTIPDSVTSIGDKAFDYCENLNSVYITDLANWCNIDFYGPKSNPLCYAESLYLNEQLVTELVVPKGVEKIKNYTFYSYNPLLTLTIPDSVTEIGDYAFAYCKLLTNATIPNTVTSIGNWSFGVCESLVDIVIPDSVISIGYSAFTCCESFTDMIIPDSVTSIGNYAFSDCNSLTTITIGGKVTDIGKGVFYRCNSIEKITIPDSVSCIGRETFYGCTSLTSVIIPNSVTCIEDFAFYDCESLTDIIIPNSVTSIGDSAFANCSSLASVIIPGSVKSVGNNVFASCISLENVIIQEGLTNIGEYAFAWCYALEQVTLPDSLKKMDLYSFAYCEELESITISNSVTNIEEKSFVGCPNLKYIFYTGSESDWENVSIGSDNNSLTSATIHYNATGHSHSVSNTLPSQGANGEKVDTCSVCGFVNSKETLVYVNEYITTDENKNIQFNQDTNELILDISACNNLENVIISMDGYTVNSTSGSDFGFYGTGSKVQVSDSDGTQVAEYTLVVRGDVNGDSVCDVLDCMLIELARNNHTTLEGAYLLAGDLAENGQITEDDFNAVVNKALI